LFAGIIIGVLLGFFALNQVKENERDSMLPIALIVGAIIGAGSGFGIGSTIGKSVYIEERIGQADAQDGFWKEGKFWKGMTNWTDKRNGKKYQLITSKSISKYLVSTLNNRIIIRHDCTSASQQTIPKYHGQAKGYVFGKLKEEFKEEAVEAERLFPTIKG
jgi:hypothetical protein